MSHLKPFLHTGSGDYQSQEGGCEDISRRVESICPPPVGRPFYFCGYFLFFIPYRYLYIYTGISGPYGPLILALAEGWLALLTRGFASLTRSFASLTRGFASLNLSLGASPPSHPILVGTEANKNRQKGGDRSTYE